ncbi:MAG: hypothetical protein ACYCSF_00705 [Acidimicrobiales bacterium]
MSIPAATISHPTDPGPERSAADMTMRRLLRVPDRRPAPVNGDVHRLFSASILISALRCLLSYVVFPIAAPAIGAAGGVGPAIGIPIAVLALYFDAKGIRRFWLADHRYRWPITALYLAVMVLVGILLGENIAALA